MQQDITWTAHEHTHTDKSSDWFWALGIVAVSSAVVAVLFQNFLFAVLIVVGAFTMSLLAKKPARELDFSLNAKGILIGGSLYPYKMLVSFWVQDMETDHATLIVDARRFMTPHLIIPLEDVNAEQVHTYLEKYLPEEEMAEPLGQRILEMFGF